MRNELAILFAYLPVLAYPLLHFLGYLCFFSIGLGLRRTSQADWLHVCWLTTLLIVSDTSLAHVGHAVVSWGWDSILYAHNWAPFDPHWKGLEPPYWGGPLFFTMSAAAYFVAVPRSRSLVDSACIAWAASMVVFKLACLAGGCCRGTVCLQEWAERFDGIHPVQLYEAAIYGSTALLLSFLFRANVLTGRLPLVLGIGFGFGRWAVDPFRGTSVGAIGPYSLTGTLSFAVGAFCAGALVFERLRAARMMTPCSIASSVIPRDTNPDSANVS